MAEMATLARPYANAVYKLAKESESVTEWHHALDRLREAYTDSSLQRLVSSPSVSAGAKAKALFGLLGTDIPAGARNFLTVLTRGNRQELLPEIAQQFAASKARDERTLDVLITTAVKLDEEQLQGFQRSLERRFASSVNIEAKVDANIVGGAVIRAGDTVLDASIQGKLQKMRDALRHA